MSIGSSRRSPYLAAVAAFTIVLAAAGCKSSSPAPAADDASLNTAIQSRLAADPGLAGQKIQTTVQAGVATLTGSADSAAARSLAANDAAEVAGIHTVVNDVALVTISASAPPAPTPAPPPAPTAAPRKTVAAKAPAPYRQPAPIDRRAPEYAQNRPQDQPPPQYQPVQAPPPPAAPPAPTFRNVTVPAGTRLPVRITQTLDSATTQSGTAFSGVLASDVIIDGVVAFPTGTRVTGRVDDAKEAGHYSGHSLLAVSLTSISRRGESISIATETFSKEGDNRGKNSAEKIGGGAAVGAILGGIFGGGKGAAIGAGAGGGLGAGAQGVTRGQQVQIPSESLVSFRLTSPVTVRASTGGDHDNDRDRLHHDE